MSSEGGINLKMIPNEEIRIEVLRTGLSYRRIAARMKVTPEWLCRLLSRPLSDENRLRLRIAINELLLESDDQA